MSPLSERQEIILGLVVREYVEHATSIGSKILVERYNLGFSSATVRNEMAALTEMGYLRQPHTSAGREPTEAGYRYFVQRLIGENELPLTEQRTIAHQFYQARSDSMDGWMRLAAAILAKYGRGASLITAPQQQNARFKHLELIATQGRLVLLVLVLSGGEVRQQMLSLAEPVTQEALSAASHRLNAMCAGAESLNGLNLTDLSLLEQDVIKVIADMLGKGSDSPADIFRDGVSNVLAEPEFANSDSARHALRVLEERPYLEGLLSKALAPNIGVVQVVIGGENSWQELKDYSMVLSRYGIAGYATGALMVLGPQRMAYGRAIATVRYVAALMNDLVQEIYADPQKIE